MSASTGQKAQTKDDASKLDAQVSYCALLQTRTASVNGNLYVMVWVFGKIAASIQDLSLKRIHLCWCR